MKMVFIAASYATVYLMYVKFKATYDHNHDTFRIEFLLIPTFVLALVLNHEFTVMEVSELLLNDSQSGRYAALIFGLNCLPTYPHTRKSWTKLTSVNLNSKTFGHQILLGVRVNMEKHTIFSCTLIILTPMNKYLKFFFDIPHCSIF